MIRLTDPITTHWSGGTTTQLLICPADAHVADRDFDIRISTATVETEESAFTLFKGYRRKLIILEGQLELRHDSEPVKHLSPFEIHSFSGGSVTHAKGKVRDFNVIHRPDILPQIEIRTLIPGQYDFAISGKQCLMYILSGEITYDKRTFHPYDSLVVEGAGEVGRVAKGCVLVLVWF